MKIHTVGGYEKVGGNMTAVEVDGELVLFDMGADIERIVDKGLRIENMSTLEAIESGAVPNDSRIKNRKREEVAAIVVGHGHQDHCRGIPKLAGAYECPIIATPYTADIIERFIENDDEKIKNEIIRMKAGETVQISSNLELEFVPITHSIPDSVISFLRTNNGNVVYSLDFKLDEKPTLGQPVDYQKLKELGEEGVRAYIADCTRVDEPGRSSPENETRNELMDILSDAYKKRRGIIVTTFSSHIARLNNIIDANDGDRKIVMLGRSLKEYTGEASNNDLIDLSGIKVASYREEVDSILKKVSRNKAGYLLIATGNQGEPNAMLPRIANGDYPYSVSEGDLVVFSSVTIPTSVNELNREYLKNTLRKEGADLELDIHSHGHGKEEDHRDMMKMLQPEAVVPSHGGIEKLSACARIAKEQGIDDVRVSQNGGVINLD